MNILFISHKYPPAVGGMEKQSYELINGMKNYGQIHTIVIQKESQFRFITKTMISIRKYLAKHPEIEIIHINDGLLACILAPFIKNLVVKKVVTVHGLEASYPGKTYKKFIFSKLNIYDSIICVSNHTMNLCIQNGINPSKLHVIHNGVEINSAFEKSLIEEDLPFQLPKNKKIVVSVGRLVKRKGFLWFASEVMPNLGDQYCYVIVGKYFKESSIRKLLLSILPDSLIKKYDLLVGYPTDNASLQKFKSNNVILAGRLSDQELHQLLQLADFFIVPNVPIAGDAEGFGLVALEGAIAQKVVLAADLEGLKDVISDGKNGYLIPALDKISWANKIRQLSKKSNENKDFGYHAKNYSLQKFSWDKMCLEYFQLFTKITSVNFRTVHTEHSSVTF